ncbi:hypothetical protein BGZ94_004886 [Podila epigama]|nr:hypothetical protein BGZ94_004886 [Podila epigama]
MSGLVKKPASFTKESEEPTAGDVALMAQGTQAYSMLKRIQEHPIELADIIRLLVTKKAILALPTSLATSDDYPPQRSFFEDHVIIPESNHGESLFVTLSGIRGVLKPASSSVSIIGTASGHTFDTIVSDASGPAKRMFFDTISKSADAQEASVATTDFKLVNSSRRPVMIFVESVGSIQAFLLDKSFARPDEIPTPIAPTLKSSLKDHSVHSLTRSTSSSGSVNSSIARETRDPLPELPKIATDLPLEWDSVTRDLESFIIKLRRNPLSNPDKYANEFQRKYDEVRHRFEVYGSASGLGHRWSEHDFDEVQSWPNSEDYLLDEQLQAKIAALNFMDLTLEHLGFVLEHPEDMAHIASVVRQGGLDSLNREPAVQDMLAATEASETKESKENLQVTSNTATEISSLNEPTTGVNDVDSSANRRHSMPRIPMDEDIRSLEPDQKALHVHSPIIMMDEGYDKPALRTTDDESVPILSESGIKQPVIGQSKNVQVGEGVTTTESFAEQVESDNTLSKSNCTGSGVTDKMDKVDKSIDQDVDPAQIPLPSSPILEATKPLTQNNGARKHYSADVLLPLLIFSVVKSNPPMLISNLRFIQRFKVQDHLTSELAYCLTNMMAVVSFLETLDPQALGLSSDIRVLRAQHGNTTPVPLINIQEGLDQTKALGHKVSQEIVGVAEEGLKVISDVVQDGYSKFFGRFLATTDNPVARGNVRSRESMSAVSSLAALAPTNTETTGVKTSTEDTRTEGLVATQVTPALPTSNVAVVSVGSSTDSSSQSPAQIAAARVQNYVENMKGPQIQYMACTNYEDLRLSDVKLLLEDYQRIGRMLDELKKLAY